MPTAGVRVCEDIEAGWWGSSFHRGSRHDTRDQTYALLRSTCFKVQVYFKHESDQVIILAHQHAQRPTEHPLLTQHGRSSNQVTGIRANRAQAVLADSSREC
jgi:hypothetical protein